MSMPVTWCHRCNRPAVDCRCMQEDAANLRIAGAKPCVVPGCPGISDKDGEPCTAQRTSDAPIRDGLLAAALEHVPRGTALRASIRAELGELPESASSSSTEVNACKCGRSMSTCPCFADGFEHGVAYEDPEQSAPKASAAGPPSREWLEGENEQLRDDLKRMRPIVDACADWVEDTNDCHFCTLEWPNGEDGEPKHGDDCPMPALQPERQRRERAQDLVPPAPEYDGVPRPSEPLPHHVEADNASAALSLADAARELLGWPWDAPEVLDWPEVRIDLANLRRALAAPGSGKDSEPCAHVWTRTGSDTLFCFKCKTAVNEPEDK